MRIAMSVPSCIPIFSLLTRLPMRDLSLLYIFRQHFLHIATKLHQTVSLLIHCDSNTLYRRKEICTTLLRCRSTLEVSRCVLILVKRVQQGHLCLQALHSTCTPCHVLAQLRSLLYVSMCTHARARVRAHTHTLYMYILNLSISNLQLEKTIYFAVHQLAFSRLGRLQEAKNKTKLVGIN